VLTRIDRTQPERGEQPSAGQAVERGQLLGQQHRVAPGHHQHGEPELEALRAARGDGDADDRVRAVARDPLRQPE
jgi:hypothetical protein